MEQQQLQLDIESLTLECSTLQQMLDTQKSIHGTEMEQIAAKLEFQQAENLQLKQALVETKRELQHTKDQLVQNSLSHLTRHNSPTPRKRERPVMAVLDVNVLSSPTKRAAKEKLATTSASAPTALSLLEAFPISPTKGKITSLEISNEDLQNEVRLLRLKVDQLQTINDTITERVALLETENETLIMQKQLLLEDLANAQSLASDLSGQIRSNSTNHDQCEQSLKLKNRTLQERLQSWSKLIEQNEHEKSQLHQRISKLEQLCNLLELKKGVICRNTTKPVGA